MFSTLRPDGIIYVLDKRNVPALMVGRVVSVSNPVPKYATTFNPASGMETTVDIVVNIDDKHSEFKKVPSNLSIYGENGIVISESREAMMAEIDSIQNASRKAIESVPYHEKVIPACDEIKALLDPSIANDKAQEKKIAELEKQIANMGALMEKMNATLEKFTS